MTLMQFCPPIVMAQTLKVWMSFSKSAMVCLFEGLIDALTTLFCARVICV